MRCMLEPRDRVRNFRGGAPPKIVRTFLLTHPPYDSRRDAGDASTQHPVTLGSANKDSMLQCLVFPEHSPRAQPFKALALK